jgi:hypothetical protein
MTMPFERDPATDDRRPSWAGQLKSLSVILEGEFGVPFRFYQAETGLALDGKGADEEPGRAGLLAVGAATSSHSPFPTPIGRRRSPSG